MALEGPSLSLDSFTWEPTGSDENPQSRLLSTLYISGYPLHVEAYEVRRDEQVGQTTADKMFEDDLNHYYAATCLEGRFDTIMINGREYIIVATPFA